MGHYRRSEQAKAEFGARPRRALVMTTVVHESRAVQSHLSDVEVVVGSNGTLYQVGTFSDPAGDWAVIHAICQAGNVDAAGTAHGAHSDFGSFDVQIFVGVAGSLKEDVPIGSVVIGNYVYNIHSAKVDDEGRHPRPHGYPAAYDLLQAAKMLIIDGSWTDLIKPPVKTVIPAVTDYPCAYPPVAVIKPIASAEQVVAGEKAQTYQDIKKEYSDAAAVEMEGWGAMNAAHVQCTSGIVIRGISDMCVGKDQAADEQFQPIASAHAAAFAFSLLSICSRANPRAPGGSDLLAQISKPEHVRALEPRVEFVVNFKGKISDWSGNQIESVIDGLRRLTGDPEVHLVRVDEGSVRLVISVREKDVPSLTFEAVKSAAADKGNLLLGAVTAHELAKAEDAKAALRLASADLLSWDQTLPGGGWLERPEKDNIENRFRFEFSSTVVLGEPGSGKSALLSAIASDLVQAGASVLAIKADFVSADVQNEQDLQGNLCLPVLPSELIGQLAQLQPVFLLVDQLDALASQLDLKSDRLNVLLNLVRRVGGLPNVHIVLSARTFEFNHDVRLRAIEAEAVTLALPAWHMVKETLTAAGVDADTWPENARDVVRNPQALKIYLSLRNVKDDQPFSKYQSMLEQLWRQKITTASNSEPLASLASELASTMAEEETLWLAASRFDTRALALEGLESAGLIVRSDDGKSVAFSHQTVFDYVLARSFVRAAGLLSTYVVERQNSLFVRAKLWSALRYLRDAEITSYEREFLEIWRHQGLRHHLRLLLIEFLGELSNPVAFEKVCLEEVMQSQDLRVIGLKSIVGSPGWFANFAQTAISKAMVGSDIAANQALRILQGAWKFNVDEVVRLLRDHWLPMPERDGFTWLALDGCPTWTEDVEEVAKTVLSRTPISPWHVDHTASVIAVSQPEVALRLIREKLNFLLQEALVTQPGKPFPKDGAYDEQVAWQFTDGPNKPLTSILEDIEWTSLPAMAEAEPQMFLQVLWPWFSTVFGELRDRLGEETDDHTYPRIYSVDAGLGNETVEGIPREHPILLSLRLAIEGTAAKNDTFFSNWARENSGLEFMESQRLISHGFGWVPETYAQQAYDWLLEDPRRLQLGNSYGRRQTTAALISAVSPYWTDEQVRNFESNVKKYRPSMPAHFTDPEMRRHFEQFIRTTKAHLLGSIPLNRLSDKSKELVATEKRALGDDLDPGIRLTGGGYIGSPMESQAMAKAKDREILKIFNEVPDSTDWNHPKGWMRGGNIQLSRAFAEFAKKEPIRALRIMEQFEPRNQERAAGYALDSMAEIDGYDREIQDAILDLHKRGFGTEEFRNSVANAVEKISGRPASISPFVIDMLIGWLSASIGSDETSGNEKGPAIIEDDEQEKSKEVRHESILWGHGGISILPGGNFPILSALTSILLKKTEEGRDRLLIILNEHLPRERNPKVWQALLRSLSNAGGSTPEIVSDFIRALFARYPALLETHEAVHFLAYAQRWDDVLVHDQIVGWDAAENVMLRQAQGELVGLVSIVRHSDRWNKMQDELLERGSPEAKIGLAFAAAHLWVEPQFHVAAGSLMQRLIPGADKARMSAILDVFRLCDDLVPEPTTFDLLRALAAPEVKLAGVPSMFVVEKLQSLLPHAADIVGEIALKLVEEWRNDLSDIRTASSIAAPQLTDLSITLHRLGGLSRNIGITIFEALIDLDAYGVRETQAEIDGRFGIHQTGARRRISRRVPNRAKAKRLS
jgi:nucleoside phosphorylase